ncbi:MAG: tyrosine-type recombinase/integrase [Acidobacteriota bacterium]|nr:tyrosine-type recombinase/integrase [Acidobacteriota bacterium]
MLNFAIENDWLIKNPFKKKKGIISKDSENERDRILTFEEEFRLLSVCTDKRAHLKPILICGLDTGMRRGEMFKMRWRDVDFQTGEIYIPQTNTKTDEARKVGMTSRLKTELERLCRQPMKLAERPPTPERGYRDNKRISRLKNPIKFFVIP